MNSKVKKTPKNSISGLLPINKSIGFTSFYLVKILRKITNVNKIGHAGTLDPFAEGVMLLLIGKEYTKKANTLINLDKEYLATIKLGESTDTYDIEGEVQNSSNYVPTLLEIETAINSFQGKISQIPPMFSAKKINGKKLYELARQKITVERAPQIVNVETKLIKYEYPNLILQIKCSKGTYIRSIANDLGLILKTYAHLSKLTRTRVGSYYLKDCINQENLKNTPFETFLCNL